MTARRLAPADLPGWPRLMDARLAAAYLGMSTGSLHRLPVVPLRIGAMVRYDRLQLDRVADHLETVPSSPPGDWTELFDEDQGAGAQGL